MSLGARVATGGVALMFVLAVANTIDECWYGPRYTLEVVYFWTNPDNGNRCMTYSTEPLTGLPFDRPPKTEIRCDNRDHGHGTLDITCVTQRWRDGRVQRRCNPTEPAGLD